MHVVNAPYSAPVVMPSPVRGGLPCGTGVALKAIHYGAALEASRPPAFLEVHAENYLHAGGPAHRWLEAIRERYALSIHGVGLSLGGPSPPSREALQARRALLQRYAPAQFSEHLAWTQLDGRHFNDLLPIAYTPSSLARVVAHVDATQAALGCRILIENPATYLQFAASTWSEPQFIAELVRRTGCGLLLDVNNIVVSAANHGFDAAEYLADLPLAQVGEVHLAAHQVRTDRRGRTLLVDTHDGPVQPDTWALFAQLLALTGPLPTLIEWDAGVPEWNVLLQEADAAARHLQRTAQTHAGH